ncbi:hypothetical protein GBAR_LOCUS20576 [Geodia barretti]|uniref:Uncharacterized protein n=1 Tax=Geodia barretti TaxID=519541 RepID=A0AA35X3Q4_GEOBA|nr:hypothetical protein GBAR_LOCUS20576 [Geodia barretti]
MTRKPFEDNVSRAHLELTAMFEALSPEYRGSVVMRALRARDHVSTDSGRALDSAIRGSIRMVGYSNPALAISSALTEPVSSNIGKSEKLAIATLRVWAESMEELEKLVSGHLASQGLPTEYPDFENSRFRGFWDEDTWQKELDWIVDLSEIWSEEDVALMLCYVSGRTVVMDEDDDRDIGTDSFVEISSIRDKPAMVEAEKEPEPEEEEAPVVEQAPQPAPQPAPVPAAVVPPQRPPSAPAAINGPAILNQCIDYLSSLSPEDWNWNEAVPAFVDAVSNIRSLKSAQRERRSSLVAAHSEITQEFSADLEFLEQDTSFWSAQGLTELSELDRTLELASGLRNLLNEYREVRRPGATLSEELGRRERRFALEPRILDTMGLMRQAMTGGRGSRGGATGSDADSGGDSSEPSGLRSSNNGQTSGGRENYQTELTYEPLDDGIVPEPGD